MKKIIIYMLSLLVAFIFAACGSDSKVDPISQEPEIPDTSLILANVTTPIEVNVDNELKMISVDVLDKNGIGVEDYNVSISAVDGVEHGSIVSSSVTKTDSSGHATFTYKAPSNVSAVNGQSTVVRLFMVNDGVTITQDVTITFKKINVGVSVPIVVIPNTYKNITLSSNNQAVQMIVQVFEEGTNSPYTSGNVKVSLPNTVLDGIDVGYFAEYIVPVDDNGRAVFNYTGPQDLQELIDSGETGAIFEFHHELNTESVGIIATIHDLSNNYIPANYTLSTSSSDGKQTMGLDTIKQFTYSLKDDLGNLIVDTDILKVVINSKNTLIGELIDATNSGTVVPTLEYNNLEALNNYSFPVKTKTLSGLLPIEIVIDFIDGNQQQKTIKITMNIVVLSGAPTAMSISYAGVEQNASTAKYIEKFVVTVTDAYNNPVSDQNVHGSPYYIAVGGMVEYAVDGSSPSGERTSTSPRLWHGLNDSQGNLESIGGDKAQFTTNTDTFKYVDLANDKLVLFGQGYVYEALGKWDLESSSDTALELKDNYYGTDREGLYFAVGHNHRVDLCFPDARQYVGNMKSNTYQIKDGHAFIEFEYDYHLTGKDIMIWVNMTGFQADNGTITRIGEATKHTLRGMGLKTDNLYTLAAGSNQVPLRFNISHENAPEWYRNGHFGYAVEGTCFVEEILDSSNAYDARECYNGGVVFVDLLVSNPSAEECSITLKSINVASEFNGVTYP